ncbi:unnamed protein product [Arctia plantaginis]|uniref:Uncharacterized protein n=1 Tax=Arctia plantaginis TaxID=874455 RepID=A0A8S0ZYD3_ARCPL|nr:unnamed protein product [Arctia plantaginis]CAB3238830.1 unnamed protein product [Arctia plantaginis]
MTVPAIQTLSEVVESKVPSNNEPKTSSISNWFSTQWRKILAEFISTLMLVLLGCLSCVPAGEERTAVITALSFGMVVMFNIQIFGHLSGAYMNPAVTLASVIWGSTSVSLGIAYTIVQCVGAILGYGILDALTSMELSEGSICVTKPFYGQSVIQSLFIEVALTSILMLVNCAVWDPVNKDKQDSIPIKFGLTILGLSLIGGPFTGASMNPARTLGPAVWTNDWTEHWIYWVGPVLGTVITVIPYKYIFL